MGSWGVGDNYWIFKPVLCFKRSRHLTCNQHFVDESHWYLTRRLLKSELQVNYNAVPDFDQQAAKKEALS